MRRSFTSIAVCCTLALLAAACGGEADDGGGDEVGGGATETTAADTADDARAEIQELVVGYREDPWLAGETDAKRFPSYPLNADVCETMVVLSPEFEAVEGLATDWELVDDDTFRFTLREDVTFSDGTPMTAEDVAYTLDYTAEEPSTSGFGFIGPDSTEVIDDYTVEVTPTEPNLRLIEQINHPTYAVLAPGSDPLGDPEGTKCTGPFKVASYTPEAELVVERNESYWGEPPILDKITFRFFPDDTTRSLALQNGEVDLITDMPRNIVSNLEALPGIEIVNAPPGQVILIYVSQRDTEGERILADPAVRRAVAHAMDREEFVDGVLGGNAAVVNTVAPPSVLGEHADLVEGVDYDPEAAAALLDEAGWELGSDGVRTKDGQRLELSIVFARVDLTTVEFVQSQLKEVGIVGNIEQLDPAAYSDRLANGTYDLDLSLPNQNDANPAFLLSLRWYSKSSVPNAAFIAPGPDTEFEALIDESQVATDPDELQRLAAEAMHELVDVEVAGIPLAGTYRIFAMHEKVRGLEPHPSGTNQRWSNVFIAE